MKSESSDLYMSDSEFSARYLEYQSRYALKIRESDLILIDRIRSIRDQETRDLRLLDVGCSNGNFLAHLSRLVPGMELFGVDISTSAIDQCSASPELAGVQFTVGSGLDFPAAFDKPFDIIVANAMVHHLSDADFAQALRSFSSALAPDGYHLNFDGFHPFEQEVALVEYAPQGSPNGIPIHYRSYGRTSKLLLEAGFDRVEFHPFEMPFDVPRPEDKYGDLTTYTVGTADGHRMSMRGCINQPWCHMFARKLSKRS